MKKEVLQSIKVIALGLVLAFGINFAIAWTGPTSAPTSNNAEGPVTLGDNVGGKNQVKLGGVNFGKSVSIGKVTDPTSSSVALDVNGGSYTKGIANLGLISIFPAGLSKGPDGQLFEVFSTSSDITIPETAVFAVDTRSSANGATTNNLTVRKNATIFGNSVTYGESSTDKLYAGKLRVGVDSEFGEYDLSLGGTTNIGLGATCTMKYSDMVTNNRSCPTGTYLTFMNPNATGVNTYAICKAFSPKTSYNSKNCYEFPALSLYLKNIYEYTYDLGSQNNNVKIPYCKPVVDVTVQAKYGDSGANNSYSFHDWYYKEPNTNYQWQGISGNACDGTSSGEKTCKITLKTSRQLVQSNSTSETFDALFKVTVTDSVGTSREITVSKTFPEIHTGACK